MYTFLYPAALLMFSVLPCILPYEDTGDSCNVYFTHIVCLRCHSRILSLLRNDIYSKTCLDLIIWIQDHIMLSLYFKVPLF